MTIFSIGIVHSISQYMKVNSSFSKLFGYSAVSQQYKNN